MDNQLKHGLGGSPNSEFVLDPQGRVARRRAWSDPGALRRDLEQLVGQVENPTSASEVELRIQPPPRVAASGVVPRVRVPGIMRPLRIEPEPSPLPYYAKLRAEADRDFFSSGSGTLYLGFHVDPLYRVHWNNLADPLRFEVSAPDGIQISPTVAEAPLVEVVSDIDPREFLLQLKAPEGFREPLRLSVLYYACNDEEGWCIPVPQNYRIHLEADADGGQNLRRGWAWEHR